MTLLKKKKRKENSLGEILAMFLSSHHLEGCVSVFDWLRAGRLSPSKKLLWQGMGSIADIDTQRHQ